MSAQDANAELNAAAARLESAALEVDATGACVEPDWERKLDQAARSRILGSGPAPRLQRRQGLLQALADGFNLIWRKSVDRSVPQVRDEAHAIRVTIRQQPKEALQEGCARRRRPAVREIVIHQAADCGGVHLELSLEGEDRRILRLQPFLHGFSQADKVCGIGVVHVVVPGLIGLMIIGLRRSRKGAAA